MNTSFSFQITSLTEFSLLNSISMLNQLKQEKKLLPKFSVKLRPQGFINRKGWKKLTTLVETLLDGREKKISRVEFIER